MAELGKDKGGNKGATGIGAARRSLPADRGTALRLTPNVALICLVAGLPGLAEAQDRELREAPIIVTLPGPERNAGELISHASVVEGDDLVELLGPSLGDTLAGLPGVASTAFGQGASRPVLRGLGAERVQVLTNGLGVIDASAASPDHQVTADGIDAVRIEIVRGPAALAYGGQAIGGVVNVIDGLTVEARPDAALSGAGLAAFNSVNEGTEFGARISGARGPLVATFTASKRDLGDYDIPGFAASEGLRASDPAADLSRDVAGNSFAETETLGGGLSWVGDQGFIGVALRAQNAFYGLPGSVDETPFIDLEQTRVDLRAGRAFSGAIISQVRASAAFADYEHTEFEAPGEAGTVFTADGVEARLEAVHQIFGADGLAGLQYATGDLDAVGDEAFLTATSTERLGVFLHEVFERDDGFGVEGGVRVEQVELENRDAGQVDFDLVSVSLGLHRHTDAWFAGVQVSRTERAPTGVELFADGPHLATRQFELGDASLDKESALNFEARLGWETAAWSASLNLFATDFSDFIYLSPTGTIEDDLPVFAAFASDAEFAGGEAILMWSPIQTWANANWHAEFSLEAVSASLDGGGTVPFLPPVTARFDLEADWQRFRARVNLTHASDQDEAGAGQLPTDGYTSADVNLAFVPDAKADWQIFVQARNVTDAEVRYATSTLKDLLPQPGRNLRAGVSVRF